MLKEIYKPIKGFEEYYQISNFGNVIGHYGRPIKLHHNGKGYYNLHLRVNKIRTIKYVHRLVAEHFLDNPENKPQINHIDGNKKNNHVSNLEWVTAKENIEHKHNVLRKKPKNDPITGQWVW